MPLAGYAELIAKVDTEVLDGLAARIATAPIATGTLQRALATTDDPDLQYAAALALRRRGVRDLGDHAPLPPARGGAVDRWHWDRALAVDEDDPAAAARFLAERGQDPLSTALGRQVAFVLPILVAHGDAAQLLPVLDRCDEAMCRAVFARLDAADRRRLLRESEAVLAWLPAASDAADCDALWAYAQRHEELGSVLEALARSAVGRAWVEGRIAADPAAADASGLRPDWADELGLDPDTMQAPVDAPWRPLLLRVARGESAAAFTPAERRVFDGLRALRGVR